MRKKILVIGGAGFIGSAYVREIERNGFEAIVYDLPKSILDEKTLFNMIRQVHYVVHFAAMADVTVCIKEQDATFETNVRGTYNVAKICAQEYKPLIFISTCCVYGNSLDDVEVEDKTTPQAAEPYAVSKVAGEYILRGMPYLRYAILRIGTVYGPGMREALFTYITLDRIRKEEKVYVDGDGTQSRQLIYIEDLVDGIVRATKKIEEIPNGSVINLCGIESTSALDTVFVSQEVVGKKAIFEHREQRYGQTFHENISTERAYKLLGWMPKTKFKDGMLYTFKTDPRFR